MGQRINSAVWMENQNRWQIKVQKDGDCKAFYFSTPGRKRQRECNTKADAWLDDQLINPGDKVSVLFPQWLAELKDTTGTSHYRKNKEIWENRAKKRIGHLKTGTLTEQQLQVIINDGYKDGLAKKTLINIRACLAAFIKYARKCKTTTLYPENLFISKGATVGERDILQPEDLTILFSCNDTVMRGKQIPEPLVYAWRLQVLTRLGPGEALGLHWDDIEMDNKILRVRRSVNVQGEVTTGKNDNAKRTFVLMDDAYQVLMDYKRNLPILSYCLFLEKTEAI